MAFKQAKYPLQVVGYLDYPLLEENGDSIKGEPDKTHCMACSGGAGHADDDRSACARRAEQMQHRAIKSQA